LCHRILDRRGAGRGGECRNRRSTLERPR
jgi:hypothetical protein